STRRSSSMRTESAAMPSGVNAASPAGCAASAAPGPCSTVAPSSPTLLLCAELLLEFLADLGHVPARDFLQRLVVLAVAHTHAHLAARARVFGAVPDAYAHVVAG